MNIEEASKLVEGFANDLIIKQGYFIVALPEPARVREVLDRGIVFIDNHPLFVMAEATREEFFAQEDEMRERIPSCLLRMDQDMFDSYYRYFYKVTAE